MTAITTRQTAGAGATVKGSPLTNTEVDTNFINIVNNKFEKSGDTAGFVTFNTALATPPTAPGSLYWDSADGNQTLSLIMAGGTATQQIGEEQYYRIKASSAITNGQVVMFTGTVGASGALTGAPATGLTASTASYVMGVATQDIPNNGWGYVTSFGLIRQIDTSAFSAGDILYLDPSVPGGLTTTIPTAPNPKVQVCACIYSSASNGSLFIRPSFGGVLGQYEGDVNFTAPSTGQTIVYNSSTGTWTNSNAPVLSGTTIDNTVIGGTTPNAGTFTTLTATGQTEFQSTVTSGTTQVFLRNTVQASGYMEFAVTDGSRYAELGLLKSGANGYGNTNEAFLRASGSTAGLSISSASTNPIRFSVGPSGSSSEQFRVNNTASAVNYVQVTGAATGSGPTISAQGSDTNVALNIASKAAQNINFRTGASSLAQFTVVHNGATIVNQSTASGSATGFAPIFGVQGSDTNISLAFQSKGTGAIDLAAGSSGVNISNGGTVTAITRTNTGANNYTSIPTVTVSVPTTAGGVQATASANMGLTGQSIASGGTGYTVGDVLSVVGGTGTAAQLTVATVSAGVITSVTNGPSNGIYSVLPTSPVSVTGGTGSGATFNLLNWNVYSLNITNAGSGYVEQPTVSFSGGGGSGAAAYATVGSGTVVKSIGSTLSLYTPAGEGFRVDNTGFSTLTDYVYARGGASVSGAYLGVNGSTANSSLYTSSKGSGFLQFFTNNWTNEQLRVAHTASAVNYVQVTGAATGSSNYPTISAQGSDSTVNLRLSTKGASTFDIQNGGTTRFLIDSTGANKLGISSSGGVGFQVSATASQVNYLSTTGTISGANNVALTANGTDTNIDLALTPKGTGVVRAGGYEVITTNNIYTYADPAGTAVAMAIALG